MTVGRMPELMASAGGSWSILLTVVLTEEEITGPEYILALSEILLHGEYVTGGSSFGKFIPKHFVSFLKT